MKTRVPFQSYGTVKCKIRNVSIQYFHASPFKTSSRAGLLDAYLLSNEKERKNVEDVDLVGKAFDCKRLPSYTNMYILKIQKTTNDKKQFLRLPASENSIENVLKTETKEINTMHVVDA
ncbi:hypothetical protein STEG23_029187 [Scotinomys teguina]